MALRSPLCLCCFGGASDLQPSGPRVSGSPFHPPRGRCTYGASPFSDTHQRRSNSTSEPCDESSECRESAQSNQPVTGALCGPCRRR
jgi:hypothetical protein